MSYLKTLAALVVFAALTLAQAPSGSLRGIVTDESGALVPSATVTLLGKGFKKSATSDGSGNYVIAQVPAGTYSLQADAEGMAQFQNGTVVIHGGTPDTLTIKMLVKIEKQEVTVQETAAPTVSVEATNNAGALVLRKEDLDALPDDPDDLAADLQALAGPSAGPNGGQIFIDGFSGGRLPPKESIREIRINQNPFSSEYDRLGFGRIEIFTKPGSDKFRGQANFNISDTALNARNPFGASQKAPFQSRQYGGNLSGPINKRSSFFIDFERREIDDVAAINATILDTNLNPLNYRQNLDTPARRTTISPRFDYQLTPNNTLMGRYTWTRNETQNQGPGDFTLATRAANLTETDQTVQMTETAVIHGKIINETRFQYSRSHTDQNAVKTLPTISVLDSFNGGGSTIGLAYNQQDRYELQNFTSFAKGAHSIKWGGRLRVANLTDSSPSNFLGTFTFAGLPNAPQLDSNNQPTGNLIQITSLEALRRTLLFENLGYSPAQIRALGGGPTQFSISGGQARQSVSQADIGVFFQDDWRVRPNFTLSMGLRYETQTNIGDWRDFAPRIGFAWAPGAKAGQRQPKTVFRGGAGIFYDRFGENYTLAAQRYNGLAQQRYIISCGLVSSVACTQPVFSLVNGAVTVSNVPPISALNASPAAQAITRKASDLRAPYIIQQAIGVERQLPFSSTIAVTYTHSRGVHELLSRNINAPLPGTTSFPFGGTGQIDQYESVGLLDQNQLMVNLNTRIGTKVTMFTGYSFNHAKSNADGVGSFPANQYDLRSEYGRSSLDVHHRLFLGGSVVTKYAIRLSPFITAQSGAPFNITSGYDLNGDSVFTDRPSFATSASNPSDVVTTRFGSFDTKPKPGEIIIPRNYGDGPSRFTVNMRVSKTFGFGPDREQRMSGLGGGEPPRGGPGGGGGGRPGGPGGMGMGGGRGMGGMFGDASTSKRYNLIVSANARNLLNHTNQGNYIGNLTSPIFGQANSLAGGFGPQGAANNRRIEFSARLTF